VALLVEYALYFKSIIFVLIISFACLAAKAAVDRNVRAIQEGNNYYGCTHITINNIDNKNNNVPYHDRLNQTLSVRGIINLSDSNIVLKPSMVLPFSIFTSRPADSHFAIDLLDEKGRVLADYPVDIIVSKAKVVEWNTISPMYSKDHNRQR
jgi:hypothetical protein